jgi:hypothetical protein
MAEHTDIGDFIENGTMTDIPGYVEEKQTVVDEEAINESLDPVTDALSGFREFGDWVIESITDLLSSVFGNLM